jgi:hypothetical protein
MPHNRTRDNKTVTRPQVEQVLARAGVPPDIVKTALDAVQFPASHSVVCHRLETLGLGAGQLVERMGGSP